MIFPSLSIEVKFSDRSYRGDIIQTDIPRNILEYHIVHISDDDLIWFVTILYYCSRKDSNETASSAYLQYCFIFQDMRV